MGCTYLCACEIKQLHNVDVFSVNLVGNWRGPPQWEILFFNGMSRFMLSHLKKIYNFIVCEGRKDRLRARHIKNKALSQHDREQWNHHYM